jgi:hypothetical protein
VYLNSVEAYNPGHQYLHQSALCPHPGRPRGVAAVRGSIYALGGRNAAATELAPNEPLHALTRSRVSETG